MKVKLSSPAEGKQPGDTVTVDDERGNWLVEQGYAVKQAEPKPKAEPKAAKAD